MNRCLDGLVAALVVAIGVGTSVAGEGKSWVGKTVLHTKPAEKIKFGDRLGDKEVSYAFSGRWPFKVRDDKDGWLRLHDGRHEGWVDKADFVLVREAFAYFDGRIRANPRDSFALLMRGAYWREKKEPDKGIQDYTAYIALNARNAGAFNDRGLCWTDKKDYDKAIADFDEALRINPKNTVTYGNRGFVHRQREDWDDAIRDYDKAIQLEPNFANAYFGRGVGWRGKKDYDKAIHDFGLAIKHDPKHVGAHNDRGLCWAAKHQYDDALKDYNEALRLNPKNTVTYVNRAVSLKLTKQYDKAVRDYEEAIRLDGKNVRAHSNLAWLLATCHEENVRNGKRAVELATKACQLTKWKEAAHLDVLAAAYAEAGQFDQAVRYEKQALESAVFAKQSGNQARKRLKLYEEGKPYHE